MNPRSQMSLGSILFAFLNNNPSDVYKSLQSKLRMRVADSKYENYRKIQSEATILSNRRRKGEKRKKEVMSL